MGFTNRKNKARRAPSSAPGMKSGLAPLLSELAGSQYKAGLYKAMAIASKLATGQGARMPAKYFAASYNEIQKAEKVRAEIIKRFDRNVLRIKCDSDIIECTGKCSCADAGKCGRGVMDSGRWMALVEGKKGP